MQSEIDGDDRLWTSNADPVVACLFQNKVMFLLKIMLMSCKFMANLNFLVKMSFICMRMKNHFHIKG